jgi:sterol desaturase/sphingolipid hydroxylase (fatty acid hydroxylase superfamily)
MSGVSSLHPSDFVTAPGETLTIILESLARNVAAEGWFYLQFLTAVLLGLAVDLIRKRKLGPRYGSKSVRVDGFYGLLEALHVIQLAVILPVGLLITRGLQTWAPWLEVRALADLPAWIQLMILFVVTDFCVYWWHRLQHENKVVWQFHKTHHSQVHLNVLTTFRATVMDRIVALAILAVPAAIMRVDVAMPLAVAAVLQFHQLIIHSDSGWSFGPLDRVIVSPSFHEVHHSSLEPHLDRNYGGVLAIWDHLFRTWAPRGDQELEYGLVAERLPEAWFKQQLTPFIGLWRLFQPAVVAPPVADAVPGETPA